VNNYKLAYQDIINGIETLSLNQILLLEQNIQLIKKTKRESQQELKDNNSLTKFAGSWSSMQLEDFNDFIEFMDTQRAEIFSREVDL